MKEFIEFYVRKEKKISALSITLTLYNQIYPETFLGILGQLSCPFFFPVMLQEFMSNLTEKFWNINAMNFLRKSQKCSWKIQRVKKESIEPTRIGYDPTISGLKVERSKQCRQWDLFYARRKDNVLVDRLVLAWLWNFFFQKFKWSTFKSGLKIGISSW